MKLVYQIDQAHCFRHGIDAPSAIEALDVDPKHLPEATRNLIADRLVGCGVFERDGKTRYITAQQPGLPYLIAACEKDEAEFLRRTGGAA